MSKWPGIGHRILERIQAQGYGRNGRSGVLQFALDHQYVPTYVYKWLHDTTPDRENLERLARDLKVSEAWLLFGDRYPMEPPPPASQPALASDNTLPVQLVASPPPVRRRRGPRAKPAPRRGIMTNWPLRLAA
jgi:hypothetical protein